MLAGEPMDLKEGCSVYFFIGDDIDAMERTENTLIRQIGTPEMRELNIARLDGHAANLDELIKNMAIFPFGVEKRLVIYKNALENVREKKDIERWQKVVENVPPSTILLLEFPTVLVKKKEWMWKIFADHAWLMKWLPKADDWFCYSEFRIPSRRDLPGRIRKITEEENGKIESSAAEELARLVGDDILLLRQEIKKLCTYVNGERSITTADVQLLCTAIPEEDIFAMVDAFSRGDAPQALHHLKLLFAKQDYVRIFPMLVRQFRLLLLVKEALQEGPPASVAARLGESDYVIQKLIQQNKRFSYQELERIYRALYEMDGEVKRGNLTPEVGLELIFFENMGVKISYE